MAEPKCFAAECPSRQILDQIAGKWSMMVLAVLDDEPRRFNVIKRSLQGVTQKALTECLRRLERNGLVSRRVIPSAPVAVEYAITPLGQSLLGPFGALHRWTMDNLSAIEQARIRFDRRAAGGGQDENASMNGVSP